jgi:hypothetical protein
MQLTIPNMGGFELVSPVGQVQTWSTTLAKRHHSLQGKRIGFIDNFKPNAAPFLAFIEEMMLERYPSITTRTVHKNFTSNVLIADELKGEVDAVVNAWGD